MRTDIDAMAFSTVISALMVLVNYLARLSAMPREAVRALVLLVSPFARHVAEGGSSGTQRRSRTSPGQPGPRPSESTT